MKKVSCICPSERRPLFLRKTIGLFLSQTYENKELIIIDSGPLELILPETPMIRRIPVAAPIALGDKYRLGIHVSDGDYLAIWDDDDYHGPRKLEKQIAAIEERDVAASATTPVIVRLPAVTFGRWKPETIMEWRKGTEWMQGSDSSVVWKRSASRHERSFTTTMDMFQRMHEAGAKFTHVENDGLFAYVRHDKATWKFNPDSLMEPAPRPNWIPDHMMEFWHSGGVGR